MLCTFKQERMSQGVYIVSATPIRSMYKNVPANYTDVLLGRALIRKEPIEIRHIVYIQYVVMFIEIVPAFVRRSQS